LLTQQDFCAIIGAGMYIYRKMGHLKRRIRKP